MSLATSLYAIGDAIDPRIAYWSMKLTNGREWSERTLIPTFIKGQRGVRKLDWALDIVSTGDIHRIKELSLNCPDGRKATLEISEDMPAFQFKTKSLEMIGAGGNDLEYMVIGRVIDKASGRCECFIWDYRPYTELPYKPAQLYIPAQPATEGRPAIPEQLAIPEQPYRPAGQNLIAYKSRINKFGGWRDTVTPMGALSLEVQGFRL